jgi:hypothetical protein
MILWIPFEIIFNRVLTFKLVKVPFQGRVQILKSVSRSAIGRQDD